MAISPEAEPKVMPEAAPQVVERPQDIEIPAHIEKGGVKSVPSQFTQTVTDDSGKQPTQSPATQTVTIQIPATQQQLTVMAKGPADDASTWFAKFWIRMRQKATKLGWKIIGKGDATNV